MLRVVPVDAAFLWQAIGMQIDMPVKAFVGIEGNRILGAGGLAWTEGKCWLFLQVFDLGHGHPVQVVRWGKRMLRQAVQLGETVVWTPRDEQYESSAKLLKMLGFKFVETDEKTGKEIYSWQTPSL